jgi:hypothetical protein
MLPTLDEVKIVAGDDDYVQSIEDDNDPAFVLISSFVDTMAPAAKYGSNTKLAQTYLAAHFLSLAQTDAGGRGPVSSETIGGVSRSWTLPYLNRETIIASTQYGLMFLEIRESTTPGILVV